MEVTIEDVLDVDTRTLGLLKLLQQRGPLRLINESEGQAFWQTDDDLPERLRGLVEVSYVHPEDDNAMWQTTRRGREVLFLANEHGLLPL